ncbi:endoglucanase [Micromonospora phaseoli]|uniref:Glucanase n=1 Tax=Micromonospora phaseoli TaxID=1144548 RepID=A0A1H7BH86_9ACTN|nr:glycoside hydrolase family 6 protein [Micromonospora phaseoli]PZV94975.1 endoglucanase [Micromonospora phaseoli]GIJ79881.1 glucanase [Micromonospora phaseoli]SEJ76566.1 endoglucanase [Micromonospora phaseoli]
MLFSLPRWSVLALPAVAALLVSAGCGRPEAAPEPEPTTGASAEQARPSAPVPLAGATLFVDPNGAAAEQVATWQSAGRTDDADRIRRISEQPAAVWITSDTSQVTAAVDAVLSRATDAGQMPVLVAYHIPGRDCGSFSGGGALDGDDYRAWIRGFAAGVDGRPVTVIVEPDAVAHSLDKCDGSSDRLALLAEAVTVLKQTGTAQVYLDAGHPRWVRDVSRLSTALRGAGIEQADGFALNVSNFIRTSENVDYGRQLSDALGGRTRFVVDTSRNGAGPAGGATVDGGPAWCNPPGRRLGAAPTTSTGLDRVDALLWIKRPGESDGACRPGEPAAGQWWSEYALQLAGD